MESSRFATLTQRQRDCLAQVVRGRSSKEIGRILGISGNTVDTHLDLAMQRTGYTSRYELARDLAEFEGRAAPTVHYPSAPQGMGGRFDAGQDIPIEWPAPATPPDDRLRDGAARDGWWHVPAPKMGRRHNDLTLVTRTALLVGIIAGLAIVLVALLPMSESFQLLANFIAPPRQ